MATSYARRRNERPTILRLISKTLYCYILRITLNTRQFPTNARIDFDKDIIRVHSAVRDVFGNQRERRCRRGARLDIPRVIVRPTENVHAPERERNARRRVGTRI